MNVMQPPCMPGYVQYVMQPPCMPGYVQYVMPAQQQQQSYMAGMMGTAPYVLQQPQQQMVMAPVSGGGMLMPQFGTGMVGGSFVAGGAPVSGSVNQGAQLPMLAAGDQQQQRQEGGGS
jgi:hypothetical protein